MASAGSPAIRSPSRPASAAEHQPWLSWQRWAVRLLAALPLIALALWTAHRGFASGELRLLEHRADLLRGGGPDLKSLRYGYPPLPLLLAIILPGGTLALSITACLFSGVILTYLAERLLRRLPVPATLALLAAFVAVPAMWYASTQLIATDASLAFLAIALGAFIRFTARGETEGGFVAGIALALAYGFDPGAILFAVVMCAVAPLISHVRYQDDPAATVGIAAVVFFPVAAATLSWFFLVWKFAGTFPGSLAYAAGAHPFTFPAGVGRGLARAAVTTGLDVLHVPLYLIVAVGLYRLRPLATVGLVLPIVALAISLWLGFPYPQLSAFFMFTVLALVIVADTASRQNRHVLILAAVAQLALAICWPPASPGFTAWLHAVT
ncbi:MAG TPA: hypothetical protein VIX86_18455 [Streptosporangiaceae bacterium]